MRFVGIEYDNKSNRVHVSGYLRIPDDIYASWQIGYRKYLINTYKAENINIYPLSVSFGTNSLDDALEHTLSGKTDLASDFNKAINCTKAFPESFENNAIRRQWQNMYPSAIHTYI